MKCHTVLLPQNNRNDMEEFFLHIIFSLVYTSEPDLLFNENDAIVTLEYHFNVMVTLKLLNLTFCYYLL